MCYECVSPTGTSTGYSGPEVHDGYDRLGMVYEALGDRKQAADCYRKVIEFVRQHPEQYDLDFEATFQGWVPELDPPAAT